MMGGRSAAGRHLPVLLACLLAVGTLLLSSGVPVLDEESYLDIARQLDPLRPYDWWRPWQPWGSTREGDAFVYAHPPLHLWGVWATRRLVSEELGLYALKVLAGAPWALLYGWAVGSLAAQLTRRPILAVLSWASAPIVALGLQRGLMPDLALAALSAAAVAGWRVGLQGGRVAAVVGGLCLAGAMWTKYPAMILVPVLLLHGRRATGSWGAALRVGGLFWAAALLPVLAGEAWLAMSYGRLHLVEVLGRAGEIERSDPRARALGVLARLALGVVPIVLLGRGLRRNLLWGALLGVGAVALAWGPADLDLPTALRVLPFAAVGGAVLAAIAQQAGPGAARGPGGPGDGLLLASWAGLWILLVVVAHNFAAPRYMLPAMAPLALLLARAYDARRTAREVMIAGAAVGALLSGAIVQAEHRFFEAADALALEAARTWQSPGAFTGEWSFRYRLEQLGWHVLGSGEASGVLVLAPLNSSPAELPEVKEHVADYRYDQGRLRVVCAPCRVGLYSEALGVVPLGWRLGPLEEATAWRIR